MANGHVFVVSTLLAIFCASLRNSTSHDGNISTNLSQTETVEQGI